MQHGWSELVLKIKELEAARGALEQENKALRGMLETVIAHRQKSHSELVVLLTTLISKLPINDIGVLVSRLVEHNNSVNHFLNGIVKGGVDAPMEQPDLIKTLEHAKADLRAAVKPLVEELCQCGAPFEKEMLTALIDDPEVFYKPSAVRARRCYVKGQVPRDRVAREFGEAAFVLFSDMTTDPKLNPHPKPDEIVLAFRREFPELLPQAEGLAPEKRDALLKLYEQVRASRSGSEAARAQHIAFQSLSFIIDLLHYYDHQNTEAVDVVFAQRLPGAIEQLVLGGGSDKLEIKLIERAEKLLGYIISTDHRQMVINNIGKGGGTAKLLKFVLRLRAPKVSDLDEIVPEFVKALVPMRSNPTPEEIQPLIQLIDPTMQKPVLRGILHTDRLRRADSEILVKAVAGTLGIEGLDEPKGDAALPPDLERQQAWGRIKEQFVQRHDPASIAAAFRDRLRAKYEGDEIRQSWITLTEVDPLSLIRVFCQLPYLADGRTDPIARPIMETYVSRLMHEKYAATYQKVLTSLKNLHRAKADSPTLVNFLTLVRWVDGEAANRLSAEIGLPVQA
jgi:hypothetical protein